MSARALRHRVQKFEAAHFAASALLLDPASEFAIVKELQARIGSMLDDAEQSGRQLPIATIQALAAAAYALSAIGRHYLTQAPGHHGKCLAALMVVLKRYAPEVVD